MPRDRRDAHLVSGYQTAHHIDIDRVIWVAARWVRTSGQFYDGIHHE
jgi:hypothetical protein